MTSRAEFFCGDQVQLIVLLLDLHRRRKRPHRHNTKLEQSMRDVMSKLTDAELDRVLRFIDEKRKRRA